MTVKKHSEKWGWLGSGTRYYIITGGRGSGKSFEVGRFLALLSFEPNHKFLYTRYTMASAADSVIPEFQSKIEYLKANDYFKILKNDIYNTQSNSQILFRGIRTSSGDQTAKLKSLEGITTWILEEAEELTDETIFDKIDYSVRTKNMTNRVILILNPTTKAHWIYKRFFENVGIQEGFTGSVNGVTYIHTTYLDNIQNLNPSFLSNIEKMKDTNLTKFKHIILGGWVDKAENVIFKNWEFGEFDNSLPYCYGLDFGFYPDPDVLVKVAIDNKAMRLYVKEMFRANEQSPKVLFERIKSVVGTDTVIADSAEKRLNADFRASGLKIVPVQKGAGSVIDGLKIMGDYTIIVDQNSTNIATELNNYSTKNGIPIDDFNHAIDAIRYVVMTFTRQRTGIKVTEFVKRK